MSLRILHILDHSIPHQSGYSFRTLALLAEQRRMGWETLHLTTPKQEVSAADEEIVDGWTFFAPGAQRRPPASAATCCRCSPPGLA